MNEILKDNKGKYICQKCKDKVLLHPELEFSCDCNKDEKKQLDMDKYLKSIKEKYRNQNQICF